jgi:hypothetical protein
MVLRGAKLTAIASGVIYAKQRAFGLAPWSRDHDMTLSLALASRAYLVAC